MGLFVFGALLMVIAWMIAVKLGLIQLRKNNRAILMGLEESLKEAEALRVEGMGLGDKRALGYWIPRVDKWEIATCDKLNALVPAVACEFDVPEGFTVQLATGVVVLDGMHELVLRILTKRIEILERILDKWMNNNS